MRLEDALARFVVQLQADGRSQHTVDQYERGIRLLGRWLAIEGRSDDLKDIGHETLAQFLVSPDAKTSRRGGLKRPTSVNALRTSMRCFFRYAHAAGWAPTNAARLVRRARCSGPPPRGMSEADQERLLSTLAAAEGPEAERDRMLFVLMLGTGVRLSSALALNGRDVDLERGELVLWHSKGGRVERIVMGRGVRDQLRDYLAGREPGPLFPGPSGVPISRRHAQRRLEIWMRRAGCRGRGSPHSLRHSFATGLYRRTQDVLLVQRALGHRSVVSTMVYVHADEARLRAALAP